MQDVLQLLENDGVVNLVLGAIALVVGVLVRSQFSRKHDLERVWVALQTGVNEVYRDYVKAIKAGREDGKLTPLEKDIARAKAVEVAKELLAREGIALAKYYGPRIAASIVSMMADRSKTLGKLSAPLEGLQLNPELDF